MARHAVGGLGVCRDRLVSDVSEMCAQNGLALSLGAASCLSIPRHSRWALKAMPTYRSPNTRSTRSEELPAVSVRTSAASVGRMLRRLGPDTASIALAINHTRVCAGGSSVDGAEVLGEFVDLVGPNRGTERALHPADFRA